MNVFLAIIVIVIGTAVAAYAEVHFTWIGIALIVVAETFKPSNPAASSFCWRTNPSPCGRACTSSPRVAHLPRRALIYSMELGPMVEEDAWGQIKLSTR